MRVETDGLEPRLSTCGRRKSYSQHKHRLTCPARALPERDDGYVEPNGHDAFVDALKGCRHSGCERKA